MLMMILPAQKEERISGRVNGINGNGLVLSEWFIVPIGEIVGSV